MFYVVLTQQGTTKLQMWYHSSIWPWQICCNWN